MTAEEIAALTKQVKVSIRNANGESGFDGTWLQTSFNGKFRGRFAGVGMTYDAEKDEFVSPEITA